MKDSITINAYAKINPFLEITGVLPSGYHTLDMVMHTLKLHDTITITKNDSLSIDVTSDSFIVSNQKDNICFKVAVAFFEYTKIAGGVSIFIKKRIPTQAGLGGGSADGAAVLEGLNSIFDTKLTQKELINIGSQIGADIPFCIVKGTAKVSGFGEIVEPISPFFAHFIVIKPDFSIDTSKAFKNYDSNPSKIIISSENITKSINNNIPCDIYSNMFNRFEQIDYFEEIAKIKSDLILCGAENALLCGSGSAVFGIYPSAQSATKAFDILAPNYPNLFKTESC